MLRRRRMIGRPVARVGRAVVGTAVVAGTAGAVHHHQQQKYAAQDAAQDAAAQQQYDQAYQQGAADAQAQQYAPPPAQYAAPVEPAPAADLTSQFQQLAQLHDAGALSDEEFAAAKQKLLAG
jgi:hypothetical protein